MLFGSAGAEDIARQTTKIGLQKDVRPWTGDLDGMLKRRVIRILVPPSKTFFFIDKGNVVGAAAEVGREFEKWLNKKYERKPFKIHVVFIPTRRDLLFEHLVAGKGDIAAGNLTITTERQAIVDFAKPWLTGIREILITGPASPKVTDVNDLGGREIMVRASSSYHTHLLALNERLRQQSRPPIKIVLADENLEDEDLLEMVSAGLLPWAIVDSHKAKLWAGILKGLTLRDDLAINEGGEIAWAVRKDTPLLKREIGAFATVHGIGTPVGSDIRLRYFTSGRTIKNVLANSETKKFDELNAYFRTYGTRYSIDPMLLAAQGYQESRFDQKLRMKSGAVGIMQIKPSTARQKQIAINDVATRAEDNIHAGAKYLRFLADNYVDDPNVDAQNQVLMALAAYNAGPGNLKKFRAKAQNGGFDPNLWFGNVEHGAAAVVGQETVQYIANIYKYYIAYSALIRK